QHLADDKFEAYLAEVEARMGLPAVDPFRQGAARLVDALVDI
ncbi:MAG: putative NAD-dependent epimerase/dehydratase family protein, partial [Reinekea sp.]